MTKAESVSDLLGRIEHEAIDGDIVKALLLCQKLGGHADSDALRSWAEKELTGWPAGEYLPDYRMLKGAMVGHGSVPGATVRAPIPTDLLPEELLDEALTIPVRFSISQIQETSKQDDIAVMPRQSGTLARILNERNQGSAILGQVHLHCPGSAYGGIVTTVRTKLINLASELGRSLPAEIAIDDKKVKAAVTRVAGDLVVVGDHAAITVGDKSKTIGDNRRWISGRRGVAALATGAAAILGAVIELLRRESIWPF